MNAWGRGIMRGARGAQFPVAILRGGLGGPWPPQIFAWPPV